MNLFRGIVKLLMPKMSLGYSQFGEDLIIAHFFAHIGIKNPTYLDIGANEPRYISNTYYFYQRGSRGVLVEPNPKLFKKLKKVRTKDKVLNVGIGLGSASEADFYLFPNYANGLSTFSKKDALHWEEVGMKGLGKVPVEKVIKMPLVTVNHILESYFNNEKPNFISIDVEGFDLEILQSMDFELFQPELICVESLSYDDKQNGVKRSDIGDFLYIKGYSLYADTHVNSIFVKSSLLS